MSKLALFLGLLGPFAAFAQKPVLPTDFITITGKIKTEKTIRISSLDSMPAKPVGDIVITNHNGDVKKTVKDARGVLLKDLLVSVELDADNPKVFSEFYFVCTASDGYSVVFSWNEIFNTPVGDQIFLITQKDGKSMDQSDERILLASAADFKTGRRYVKGLAKITVARI